MKKIQKVNHKDLKNQINKDIISQKKNQQPIYELTKHEYSLVVKNNISICDYRRVFNPKKFDGKGVSETFFSLESIGEYIKREYQFVVQKKREILLNNIKNGFLTVTIDSSELEKEEDITIMKKKKMNNMNYNSGKCLLLLCCYNKDQSILPKEIIPLFNKYRYNIMSNEAAPHFNTIGKIFGIGLVRNYKLHKNKYSFSTYATKAKKPSVQDLKIITDTMDQCMDKAIQSCKRVISCLGKWYFPIGDLLKKILLSDNDLHVEKENLKPYMSSQINLNTRTINSHTELDASYT